MQAFCNTHSDFQMEKTDETILALWKLMKYSSIKAAIYIYFRKHNKVWKLMKAATTWWLSHGEASAHLVSCFQEKLDALNAAIAWKNEP